jgi:hypothetical protein
MATIRIKLSKLDRRFKGYDLFTHRVEFSVGYNQFHNRRTMFVKFVELRNHLWARFGPSVEDTLFHMLRSSDTDVPVLTPKWAWSESDLNIFLRDEALTEFLLMKEKYENI